MPWSVTASALCPQEMAVPMRSFTSDTPSISLIFVWQCSSTRFWALVSIRRTRKSGIFLMPTTEPMVSSLSNLSMVVTPLSLMKPPCFRPPRMSLKNSFFVKILMLMVSVKSVTFMMMIVFSPRISRVSRLLIWPRTVTSPISPRI